jgi:GST-like protein
VPVEAALTLIGAHYRVIGETVLRDVAFNPDVFKVDPLGQVPALLLPGGEVMTESAAILIWLADQYPNALLAPPPTDRRRPAFLRWMAYISSAIYGLAWVRGDPMRLVSDKRQAEVALNRIANRRADCWRWMDTQIEPRQFLLGDELGVLDLYVATVSRGPRAGGASIARRRKWPRSCTGLMRIRAWLSCGRRASPFMKVGKDRRPLGCQHLARDLNVAASRRPSPSAGLAEVTITVSNNPIFKGCGRLPLSSCSAIRLQAPG